MAAVGVVRGFDPVEDRPGELFSAVPGVLVEQLALQPDEERFGDQVVVAVPDGSRRAQQAAGTSRSEMTPEQVKALVKAVGTSSTSGPTPNLRTRPNSTTSWGSASATTLTERSPSRRTLVGNKYVSEGDLNP